MASAAVTNQWHGGDNPYRSALPNSFSDPGVESLLADFTDWKSRTAGVTDRSNSLRYTIKHGSTKPQVRFTAAGETSPLGGGTLHMFSKKLDVDHRGQDIKLKVKKGSTEDYVYTSPALQNQTITWEGKNSFKSVQYDCLNESGQCIAIVTAHRFENVKLAKIEYSRAMPEDDLAKEELFLTGMTLAYNAMLATMSAGSSNVNSSGGGLAAPMPTR